MNDEHEEDYSAAYVGGVGSDRMAAGLPCIPDELRGDLHEVNRLRAALQYIAYDVRCCTLDFAMAAAKSALELPWKLKNIK